MATGNGRMVVIKSDVDVVSARQMARDLAAGLGFTSGDQTVIAAAVSEIARNILTYARHGEVEFQRMHDGERNGLHIHARDDGPGIADVTHAMQDGYSTSGGLGLGLAGARRLMDEFEIISQASVGTSIKMVKWVRVRA